MQCSVCGIENDSDAKFCKGCGTRLEATLRPGYYEHVKVGELLYAAYKYKEEGRIEDGILACHSALALNEASAPAHSLLGALYEAKGNIHSAIKEYQRAVELNPESEADKLKLEELRTSLATRGKGSPKLRSMMPYIPTIAAILLGCTVLTMGILLWVLPEKHQPESEFVGQTPTRAPTVYGNMYYQQPGGVAPPTTPNQPQPEQTAPPTAQPTPNQPTSTTSTNPSHTSPPPTNSSNSNTQPTVQVSPLAPAHPSADTRTPPATNDSPIRPIIETAPSPTVAPRESSPPPNPPKPKETLPADPEQRAYKLQIEGRYLEAIGAYKEALAKAKEPAHIHQNIGVCYQRLGQWDAAKESYRRAIAVYQEQLRAGRDRTEVERNISTCENGIRVCEEEKSKASL